MTILVDFLAHVNKVQEELLYYPRRRRRRQWRRWRRRPQMLKFLFKVLRTSLFPNPLIDLVHVWYDDRYWSKILRGTIPTPVHDLKVKVKVTGLDFFMWKFYVKVFRASLFLNPLMDLVHVWHNDGYWSKLLRCTLPTPVYDPKVQVTDLEVLGPRYFQTRSCIWLDIGPKFYRVPSPCPVHDLKVKIMDLDFSCESFTLKMLQKGKAQFRRAILSGDRSY